ncbi:PREDICTED: zinc finger protein MAGPIE-like [Nicotiana attenuata]|uniref:Zinc finger protein magpie n=1 Tax=Nicotiana attenuata TaxID=49451 RepID=A0A314KZ55_NICAT|nr:PREDICTED: zinc finger protein MAGPIE-like [Nicotiana attenuata]XP_019267570.1 PREDICTED: zinc finger protein MAGPIE-like [Nicotiana attenuata]XP_019267571.1 PREDICTED: zinc finger protein MAGPIE-like [Nicotiana attenuata]OIT34307.1 zinc finger protein magpie [Nicotiana attenuata]
MTEEVISSGFNSIEGSNPLPLKKKRNLPGNPDPEAEVIALSPKTLMATNRFLCEICGKGFQRDQNLQLHRRGHNLPWKLKQRTSKEVRKRVYVCPEKSCVHHHASRALGDLTGIKKHYCRKHGEKKWKCEKCSKRYAVQSDWKAHSKTCGTREYRCDCGTIFSRRDSFVTHRAFCDALAEETARVTAASNMHNPLAGNNINYHFIGSPLGPNMAQHFSSLFKPISTNNENSDPIMRRDQLSLWNMEQVSQQQQTIGNNNLQEIHQIGPLIQTSAAAVYDTNTLLAPRSNPPPVNYNHVNWEQLTNTSSANVTVPSLFSNQHQSHQQITPSSTASMSATALLQKAAQIGATTTTTDPSFLGNNFGMNNCNVKNNNVQVQEVNNNKLCGFYVTTTNNSITTSLGSEVDQGSVNDLSTLNQLQMYNPPSKRRHIQTREDSVTGGGVGGQTRDFLGVGVQSICHPSSINGWI